MAYFLGIDTSCYTTSSALVDEHGNLVAEERQLLRVKEGNRGLKQSEMVFQHTKNLPVLINRLEKGLSIKGIGVSATPRREEDSYMPAFLTGLGLAKSLSHLYGVPLYEFSHQENHIWAALREHRLDGTMPLLGLHVSGGTTELIYSTRQKGDFFDSTIIGGEDDIAAGQLIDRISVAMGLPFPGGPHLEDLALRAIQKEVRIPSSVRGFNMSFGGPYSAALRLLEQGVEHTEVAFAVFKCISNSLEKLVSKALETQSVKSLIAVGGVMSNQFLRTSLERVCKRMKTQVYFASPRYSADNASGNAYGAYILHRERTM